MLQWVVPTSFVEPNNLDSSKSICIIMEVERLSNCTYHWESNVTFNVVHVSTTVPRLVLFYFTSFSTRSSQHSLSIVAEAVNTVGRYRDCVQLGVMVVCK